MFFAALTLGAADLAARILAPPRNLREVEDAVAELRGSVPTALAIGSSHARTFAVLADSLERRTDGRERLLAVPVEWGKLSSYRWVLEERVLPLLDAPDSTGAPRGRALRRAIIVTEWWDSCEDGNPPRNLPARSWTWRHYLTDVRNEGLTAYNRNFIGYRWSRFWRGSALVQDRGQGRIVSALRQALAPRAEASARANYESLVDLWQGMVRDGDACIGSEREMGALQAMTDTLLRRNVEVTVLLYPRMPVTLTPEAWETTLPRFAAMVRALAEPRGVRVVDLTVAEPLSDADFGGDFDHLLPDGNARFSSWALDGPLSFLRSAPE